MWWILGRFRGLGGEDGKSKRICVREESYFNVKSPSFDPNRFVIGIQLGLGVFPYARHVHFVITNDQQLMIDHKARKEKRLHFSAEKCAAIYVHCRRILEVGLPARRKAIVCAGMMDVHLSDKIHAVSMRLETEYSTARKWLELMKLLKLDVWTSNSPQD